MTEAERVARGRRASDFMDEFLKPAIGEIGSAYYERLIEVSTTEHDKARRAEKQANLSAAVKILRNIESIVTAHIRDGELANGQMVKNYKLVEMTDAQRRLLNIGAV